MLLVAPLEVLADPSKTSAWPNMFRIDSSLFFKYAGVAGASFAKSTLKSSASAKPVRFGSKQQKFPKGNPSVDLNSTMSKFHANHDLEKLNKKGIKPSDQFTENQIDINNKGLSHQQERRLTLAHMRGR